MQNKDDQSQGSKYQPVNRHCDRPRWPFLPTNFQLAGQLDWLGIATIESGFKEKQDKKRKKERKKILCLLHFIILKLSKIVNAKMLKITGEQFFFEMFPILQCKEFFAYKAMFLPLIGYYFPITTSIFYILTGHKWAMS